MDGKLYRTREVAEFLNLSVTGVKKWIKEGKICATRVGRFWSKCESLVLNY